VDHYPKVGHAHFASAENRAKVTLPLNQTCADNDGNLAMPEIYRTNPRHFIETNLLTTTCRAPREVCVVHSRQSPQSKAGEEQATQINPIHGIYQPDILKIDQIPGIFPAPSVTHAILSCHGVTLSSSRN